MVDTGFLDSLRRAHDQILAFHEREREESWFMTLHLRKVTGDNAHHILEATFKAAARAMRVAVERDPRVEGIPSTKGVL